MSQPPDTPPEQYCDANGNGRADGIYSSGGIDALANRVHDPIDARAIDASKRLDRRDGTRVTDAVAW